MNCVRVLLSVTVSLCVLGASAGEVEWTGQVIDGMHRPLEGARVELYRYENNTTVVHASTLTDKDGRYTFRLREDQFMLKSEAMEKEYNGEIPRHLRKKYESGKKTIDMMIVIDKKGYGNVRTSGLSAKGGEFRTMALQKMGTTVEVTALADCHEDTLVAALGEVLVSFGFQHGMRGPGIGELFKMQDHIRPAAFKLMENPHTRAPALHLLSYICEPEQIEQALHRIDELKEWPLGVSYHSLPLNRATAKNLLASSLVNPATECGWKCLEQVIADRDKTLWGVGDSFLGLAATDNERAMKILKSIDLAEEKKFDRDVKRALAFREAHPGGIAYSADLSESVAAVSEIFLRSGEKDKFRIGETFYDKKKQRAYMSVSIYHAPLAARGYDMVFSLVKGKWVLRSLRATWMS